MGLFNEMNGFLQGSASAWVPGGGSTAGNGASVNAVEHQARGRDGRDRPSHDPASEDINDEGRVDRPRPALHIDGVGDPQPVGASALI